MKNCKRIYEAQTASHFKEFIHTLLTHPHKIKSYYVSGKNFSYGDIRKRYFQFKLVESFKMSKVF